MVWEMKRTELDTTDLSNFPPKKGSGKSSKRAGVEKQVRVPSSLICDKIRDTKWKEGYRFTQEMDMSHVFESQTSLEAWSSTSEKVLGLFRTKQLETRCHTPEN